MSRSAQACFGIDPCYNLNENFCQWLAPFSDHDASTAFQILNNVKQQLELPPLPPHVDVPAPTHPIIYSDGAFTHPVTPVFGLASAGIWHLGRTDDEGNLSMLED
eukprot:6604896-Karenia_brevis.AAC.1